MGVSGEYTMMKSQILMHLGYCNHILMRHNHGKSYVCLFVLLKEFTRNGFVGFIMEKIGNFLTLKDGCPEEFNHQLAVPRHHNLHYHC